MSTPFRWNIARREQLGRLITGEPLLPSADFVAALRVCGARVVAFAGNADLIFIGRSPESLFDYLSGVLAGTAWAERCTLVNISLRINSWASFEQFYPQAVAPARTLLADYGLAPEQLLQRPQPVTFVDLVATGETFGHLATLLLDWAQESQLDPAAIRRKLRFVGITHRSETSPKTWRWQQHAAWTTQFSARQIKNVSIPPELWDYLGNEQPKVTPSNPPWRWGTAALTSPVRDPAHLAALNLAVFLYDRGNASSERRTFADCLAQTPAMRERWFRALITDLRQASGV
jgi:hypothetical protein